MKMIHNYLSLDRRVKTEEFETVNTLEALLDTISLRLCNLVQGSSLLHENLETLLTNTNRLEEVLLASITSSLGHFPQHAHRLGTLLVRIKEIKQFKKLIEENSIKIDKKVQVNPIYLFFFI